MATYLPALSFTQGSKAVTDMFVNTFGSHPEGVWLCLSLYLTALL